MAQENQLIKTKRLVKFKQEFYNTEERGDFRRLMVKEMADYSGPVNYIITVEAFKNRSHSMTLLWICMNSSMKQPGNP